MSPRNSNGRLLEALKTFGVPASRQVIPTELASPNRDSVVYLSFNSALPGVQGATGVADTYEAERAAAGWATTRHLSLPGSQTRIDIPQGVSPDHLFSASEVVDVSSPLNVKKVPTFYLGEPDGSYEWIGAGSLGSEPFAQPRFLGEGGHHIVFSTGHGLLQSFVCVGTTACEVRQLEPDAAPTGTGTVYDREADGETHVISLLPGEVPQEAGQEAIWKGTSKDGSATAFEIDGTLYVRVNDEATLEVAAGNPIFAGLSDDGRYLFYVAPGSAEAGVIHRFDTMSEEDVVVNSGGQGAIVNVSGDGGHVYFISEAQLDGIKGEAGKPNLYVWSGGFPEYVTTVAASDLDHTSGSIPGLPALDNWTSGVIDGQAFDER
ncbi:MAG: hypothetical protein ACTHNY_00515, partial [Solirubrobacterales bacterium]